MSEVVNVVTVTEEQIEIQIVESNVIVISLENPKTQVIELYEKGPRGDPGIRGIDGAEGPPGLPSRENLQTEIYVLDQLQIDNKEIILQEIPFPANKTTIEIQNAPTQAYGIDFIVVTNKIIWSGLAFELLLEAGSLVIVRFYKA